MRKVYKTVVLSLIVLFSVMSTMPVQAESQHEPEAIAEVKLTEKQKKDLAAQYKDILKKEQNVIATYVKYGVITEKQGKIIAAHLENRYLKLEQNGFIPHWGKHKGKHKHHKH